MEEAKEDIQRQSRIFCGLEEELKLRKVRLDDIVASGEQKAKELRERGKFIYKQELDDLVLQYLNLIQIKCEKEADLKCLERDNTQLAEKSKVFFTNFDFVENELKLTMHPNKVSIKTISSGVDFLGWVYFPKHRVLRNSTKKRMFRNIKNNQKPNTIASYLGMLGHGDGYKLKEKIISL